MGQLNDALEAQDLKRAYDRYLVLRRYKLPTDQIESLFQNQRRLVQLFHRVRLEKQESQHAESLEKQFLLRQSQRRDVLKDIYKRTLKNYPYAKSMAALVDALGKSKAIVQHSYISNSQSKLHDWRAALKVLENWAQSNRPWREISGFSVVSSDITGDVTPTLHNTSAPVTSSSVQITAQLGIKSLERQLGTWLSRLMSRLVYSHTYLVRSMLDTIPAQYGIRTTVEMYLPLFKYYAMFGQTGYKDTLALFTKLNDNNVPWRQEPAIYDYLLYSLSHMSGNKTQADKIVNLMLANDLVPREETMKAAIMCAARSGDLEMCAGYIQRMHQEWNLTISERMKAILLYACAMRGDFDSALEILRQISGSGVLVHPNPHHRSNKRHRDTDPISSTSTSTPTPTLGSALVPDIEELLSVTDIIDNSNVLLALINQTHSRRDSKRRLTHEFVKEEVSKVLELFTVITKDPKQVDAQLYTIMMQYLSTLPSPIPGMMYLYKEMLPSENARPNNITYRVLLEACAEQMDMDVAKQLWKDMDSNNVPKDCYVRTSYVKAWGRAGHLDRAERIAREGLLEQQQIEKDRMEWFVAFRARNQRRRKLGLPELKPPRLPRRQRAGDMISLPVLHELMKSYRAHDKPERAFGLYQEIDAGQWGQRIQPNEFTLSIVLGACGSGKASSNLVDQCINLVNNYLGSQRQQHLERYREDELEQTEQSQDRTQALNERGDRYTAQFDHDSPSKQDTELLGTEFMPRDSMLPILSDVNYQLYFTMLGRHHRQSKMVEVWDDMLQSIDQPPSHLTVNLVTEALENVQWGAAPIKKMQRQLGERWPKVNWSGRGRGQWNGEDASGVGGMDEDGSVGAGGRFWR
ncbi:hypothetical protein BGZ98_001179 [Dissophora globulifera]|nr:hypothetical protein BGZ98_001179 [Dissophora globulifera]